MTVTVIFQVGADVPAAYKGTDHNRPPTTLVMVEHTHNAGGGLVRSRGALDSALKANSAVPPGASLQVLPEAAAALVQRDLSVKLL